jgi:hypothetical protein
VIACYFPDALVRLIERVDAHRLAVPNDVKMAGPFYVNDKDKKIQGDSIYFSRKKQ